MKLKISRGHIDVGLLLCLALLIAAATSGASAQIDSRQDRPGATTSGMSQETSGRVERRQDRFTGATIITLTPITLRLVSSAETITLEAVFDPSRRQNRTQYISPTATLTFRATGEAAARFASGGRDADLLFIVDGERLRRTPAGVHENTSERIASARLTRQCEIIALLPVPLLKQVASGTQVEMRLGEAEVVVDRGALQALREFADAIED